MIFRKSTKTVSKNMSRVDKLVTGIIITWAAASIFGVSRTKKWKTVTQTIKSYTKKWINIFGKTTVRVLSLFHRKK